MSHYVNQLKSQSTTQLEQFRINYWEKWDLEVNNFWGFNNPVIPFIGNNKPTLESCSNLHSETFELLDIDNLPELERSFKIHKLLRHPELTLSIQRLGIQNLILIDPTRYLTPPSQFIIRNKILNQLIKIQSGLKKSLVARESMQKIEFHLNNNHSKINADCRQAYYHWLQDVYFINDDGSVGKFKKEFKIGRTGDIFEKLVKQ